MSNAEYQMVVTRLLGAMRGELINKQVEAVPSYFKKPDFGDVDILLESGARQQEEGVLKALGAQEWVCNGEVTSLGIALGHKMVQVDLIYVPASEFNFALAYFGFNDLGNLMGRIAHKAGFKLGHLGLKYVLRDDKYSSHVLAELLVPSDWGKAIELLGYDIKSYSAGIKGEFQEVEDLFRFVLSSPYAYKDIYLLENRSHRARTRDQKRKTYQLFLNFLKQEEKEGLYETPKLKIERDNFFKTRLK